MKTTIDIASNILARSKEVARKEKITLRQLVEEGLELAVALHEQRRDVKVRPVTFKGRGLSPEFRGAGWDKIREAIYKERGA